MGKIKDLSQKVAQGKATDEEKAELEELRKEAAEVQTAEVADVDDTEEQVERLADAMVAKIGAKFDKLTADLEAKAPAAKKEVEGAYIVDKHLGKLTMSDLSEMKVEMPGRKAAGKTVTEVTGKTVAFVQALMTGDKQKLQLLTEGAAIAGGYLVPEEFANIIIEDKRDLTVMRQLANQITIQSDTLHLPTLDSRPKAAWRAEAAVKATSTAQFNELVLTPYSLAVIVGLSQELADDASLGVGGNIVQYVAQLMVRSLAEKEEEAFWTGNGTGKPTGVNNYSLTTVPLTAATDAALADALKNAYFALPQGYRNAAVFVGHGQAIARLAKVKDTTGQYLVAPLTGNPYPTINGVRVYEQNDLPTNVLLYGDFSYYTIVDRQGVTVDFSTEATVAGSSAFEKNLVFIRVEQRVDGELTLPNAIRKITIV